MNSSPVLVDDVVYTTETGDHGGICAVDTNTGERIWKFDTDGYVSSAPAVVDGILYAGMWGKWFYAVDVANGSKRWKVDVAHRFSSSSPVVADGRVFVGTVGDSPLVVTDPEDEEQFEACAVLAFDAKTGDELWHYDDFGECNSVESSPTVADGVVYVGCRHGVSAVTVDGENAWRLNFKGEREDDPYVDSSPAVAGGRVFTGASDGQLRAISEK
ncbi:PQQ-binding-like beta-propeller repeat protein [Haladaptatus pallidirubidus]|uniref:Pyrrolo-quinoline quinone repeat domain-containing protein n=1 Tax=Haladaptatus pallidirubidus TaxID=1008152 RepID=A0AAV3UGK5_9EURY|nr:PQQ-binding-like beta-propeller repeat protein [Haladaptatus pallidirubidus]